MSLYPREACPECLAGLDNLEWVKIGGQGRVHSFTIVHQSMTPAFLDDVPYVFAVVQSDEGFRMPGNVVGLGDPHECTTGMLVKVHFDDVTPE